MTKKVLVRDDDGNARELKLPTATRGAGDSRNRRRPARDGGERFTSKFLVKLTPSEHTAWYRLAAARGRTVAAVVRELMANEIAGLVTQQSRARRRAAK